MVCAAGKNPLFGCETSEVRDFFSEKRLQHPSAFQRIKHCFTAKKKLPAPPNNEKHLAHFLCPLWEIMARIAFKHKKLTWRRERMKFIRDLYRTSAKQNVLEGKWSTTEVRRIAKICVPVQLVIRESASCPKDFTPSFGFLFQSVMCPQHRKLGQEPSTRLGAFWASA